MDPFSLKFDDDRLEKRFWASWRVALLVGDGVDAVTSSGGAALMLLNRFGNVDWEFMQQHSEIWWAFAGVAVIRLANLAAMLVARQHYLRHRFAFYAALKIYMSVVAPRFLWLALQQAGLHSWALLGGRDGRVDSYKGILRALLLLTGALSSINEMLLPPFRLPWRLMAPMHLLHRGALTVAGHPGLVRLLGVFPRLAQDARLICRAVHSIPLMIFGLLHGNKIVIDACIGDRALSSTALFSSLVLALVGPLVYAYAGSQLAACWRVACRIMGCISDAPLPRQAGRCSLS